MHINKIIYIYTHFLCVHKKIQTFILFYIILLIFLLQTKYTHLFWSSLCSYVGTQWVLPICRFCILVFKYIQEIFREKIPESPKKQNLSSTCTSNCLHWIYIEFATIFYNIYVVLDIVSNLEMIQSIWRDMCRLYVNSCHFI